MSQSNVYVFYIVTLCALHHIPIQLHIFLSIGIEVLVVCDLFSATKQFNMYNLCTYIHMLDIIYVILWLIMQNVLSTCSIIYVWEFAGLITENVINQPLFTTFPGGREGELTDQESVCHSLPSPKRAWFHFQTTINWMYQSVRAQHLTTLLPLQCIVVCSTYQFDVATRTGWQAIKSAKYIYMWIFVRTNQQRINVCFHVNAWNSTTSCIHDSRNYSVTPNNVSYYC